MFYSKSVSIFLVVVFVAISIISVANVYADTKNNKLPFYFPEGIYQTSDPVQQFQEYLRITAATSYRFQPIESNNLIVGSDSIVFQTDIESTTAVRDLKSKESKKCKIILDHFVRLSDGRIRVTLLNDQIIITEQELKVVIDDLVSVIKIAAQDDYEYYKDFPAMALKARVAKMLPPTSLSTEEGLPQDTTSVPLATTSVVLEKMLNESDVLYKDVSLRELNFLPEPIRVSDFVPLELHFGYTPEAKVLGLTLLNTGIIYYNPQARIMDYVSGRPRVLQHEMIHCNPKIEKFPFTSGFDAELIAEFPMAFFDDSHIDLFFHSYDAELREMIEDYFGFDFAEAKKQIFKYNLGGAIIGIDEVKYRDLFAKLAIVKKEIREVVRNHVIPEFYSDFLWWSAMHDKLNDKNGVFRVVLAKHYRSTVLGGARETAVWLAAHHNEIMEMAKEAYKKSGEDSEEGEGVDGAIIVNGRKISRSLLSLFASMISPKDQRVVRDYFSTRPSALKKIATMNVSETLDFIKMILSQKIIKE